MAVGKAFDRVSRARNQGLTCQLIERVTESHRESQFSAFVIVAPRLRLQD